MTTTGTARAHKLETLHRTHKRLQQAILRIVNARPKRVPEGAKLTVNNVAIEAGVDRSTIYKYHAAILNEIHSRKKATSAAKLDKKRSELAQAQEQIRQFRKVAEAARDEIDTFAQVNYRMNHRVKELEALLKQRDMVIKDLQKQLNVEKESAVVSLKDKTRRKK